MKWVEGEDEYSMELKHLFPEDDEDIAFLWNIYHWMKAVAEWWKVGDAESLTIVLMNHPYKLAQEEFGAKRAMECVNRLKRKGFIAGNPEEFYFWLTERGVEEFNLLLS